MADKKITQCRITAFVGGTVWSETLDGKHKYIHDGDVFIKNAQLTGLKLEQLKQAIEDSKTDGSIIGLKGLNDGSNEN